LEGEGTLLPAVVVTTTEDDGKPEVGVSVVLGVMVTVPLAMRDTVVEEFRKLLETDDNVMLDVGVVVAADVRVVFNHRVLLTAVVLGLDVLLVMGIQEVLEEAGTLLMTEDDVKADVSVTVVPDVEVEFNERLYVAMEVVGAVVLFVKGAEVIMVVVGAVVVLVNGNEVAIEVGTSDEMDVEMRVVLRAAVVLAETVSLLVVVVVRMTLLEVVTAVLLTTGVVVEPSSHVCDTVRVMDAVAVVVVVRHLVLVTVVSLAHPRRSQRNHSAEAVASGGAVDVGLPAARGVPAASTRANR